MLSLELAAAMALLLRGTLVMGAPALDPDYVGATNIGLTSAWLTGYLTDTGSTPTYVWIYYGDNDGGTTKDNWDSTNSLGQLAEGAFSTNITSGIDSNTFYYYTIYASNSVSGVWLTNSMPFATGPWELPFTDGFETSPSRSLGELRGQNGWESTQVGAATIQNSVTYDSSTNAIKIDGTGTAVTVSHPIDDPAATNIVWTEMYVQLPWSESSTPPSGVALAWYVTTNGKIVVFNGLVEEELTSGPTVPSNSWARFTAKADYSTKKWALFYNATNVAYDKTFYNTGNSSCTAVGVQVDTNDTTYIDDVYVGLTTPSSPPVVNNSIGATPLTATSATLRGELTSGFSATAWICWGDNEAGTDSTGDWDYVVSMGSVIPDVPFSTLASGLTTNATYWYRCYVTNASGTDWSDSAASFSGTPEGLSYSSMQITFTNFAGRGTLTNFPALVRFTTSNISNYVGVLDTTNGWDLRFWTNSSLDGDQLKYEIEEFATNSNSYVWVRIPELTNNLSIWASWGDETYNSQEAYTTNGDVWSEGFQAVFHLSEFVTNEVTTGSYDDSSTNDNDGAQYNTGVGTGLVSRCGNFDGNDYIVVANESDYDFKDTITAAMWFRTESGWSQSWQMFMTKGSDQHWDLRRYSNTEQVEFITDNDNAGCIGPATNMANDEWHYFVGVYDQSDGKGRSYIDGQLYHVDTTADTDLILNNASLQISGRGGANYCHRGLIDEVRVSRAIRSSNWVWACYMNQGANHTSFVEYGTPVSGYGQIANLAPSAITNTQATLNASLAVPSTNYTAYVHWGVTNGGTNISGWTTNDEVGSWTNVASTNISYLKTGLTANTTNWFTFRASNDAGQVWATPSWKFMTPPITGATAPSFGSVLGATDATATSVDLTGEITAGDPTPHVFICWGDNDGGTNAGAWDYTIDKGTQSSTFTHSLTSSFTSGTVYSYRCYATNASGTGWATNAGRWSVRTTTSNTWVFMSSPVGWAASASNGLDSELGSQLASGLTGGTGENNSDNLWHQNAGTWERYWYANTGVWKESGGSDATLEIGPGVPFWIKRLTAGSDTMLLCGRAHQASMTMTLRQDEWTAFGWPFKEAATTDGPANGWGFLAAGGTSSYTWRYADNIIGSYQGAPFAIYLRSDGHWYDRGTVNQATIKLEPGGAYRYYRRGTNITWTASAPP